jgi:hypothetical protein
MKSVMKGTTCIGEERESSALVPTPYERPKEVTTHFCSNIMMKRKKIFNDA